ncbi:Gfo/Idh/MocA family protein [Idiomarina abyssalis]|uniref:Gfo/Idh/MocA family protein n=1 Tax=Idiomarina abyssalis TaxID=86102 RepID=UPI003A91CAED
MNKVAVVGLGNISQRHRANLRELYPEAKIFAVSASGRLPCESIENADECLSSVDDLLKYDMDMAIVASPATFHAQHAITLLGAGIPVLIEKPLTASVADAEAIATIAKDTKVIAAVGYCLRYLSSSKKVKELIQNGDLGNIYNAFVEIGQFLPDWRVGKNYKESVSANAELGGGALLELSHELDYAQWLFGELTPHSAILRSSVELELSVEDSADILAVNSEGMVISIHLDLLQRKARRRCRVIGSKGSIEWDLLSNQVKMITATDQHMVFDGSCCDRNEMYLSMLKDFKRKISNESNQCISLTEAQQTVLFVEKIKELALKR